MDNNVEWQREGREREGFGQLKNTIEREIISEHLATQSHPGIFRNTGPWQVQGFLWIEDQRIDGQYSRG